MTHILLDATAVTGVQVHHEAPDFPVKLDSFSSSKPAEHVYLNHSESTNFTTMKSSARIGNHFIANWKNRLAAIFRRKRLIPSELSEGNECNGRTQSTKSLHFHSRPISFFLKFEFPGNRHG